MKTRLSRRPVARTNSNVTSSEGAKSLPVVPTHHFASDIYDSLSPTTPTTTTPSPSSPPPLVSFEIKQVIAPLSSPIPSVSTTQVSPVPPTSTKKLVSKLTHLLTHSTSHIHGSVIHIRLTLIHLFHALQRPTPAPPVSPTPSTKSLRNSRQSLSPRKHDSSPDPGVTCTTSSSTTVESTPSSKSTCVSSKVTRRGSLSPRPSPLSSISHTIAADNSEELNESPRLISDTAMHSPTTTRANALDSSQNFKAKPVVTGSSLHSSKHSKLQLEQLRARIRLQNDSNNFDLVTGDSFWSQQGEPHPLEIGSGRDGGCTSSTSNSTCRDINGRVILDKTVKYKPPASLTTITTCYTDLDPDPSTLSPQLPHFHSSVTFSADVTKDDSCDISAATIPCAGDAPVQSSRTKMLAERKAADVQYCTMQLNTWAAKENPFIADSIFPARRATRRLVSCPMDND